MGPPSDEEIVQPEVVERGEDVEMDDQENEVVQDENEISD